MGDDERRERIAALAAHLRLHARELIDGGTNATDLRKHLFKAADLLGEVSREPDATLQTIAGFVNGYFNGETGNDALAAFRALRAIADALGPALEPSPAAHRPEPSALLQRARQRVAKRGPCRCNGEYHDSCRDTQLIEDLTEALAAAPTEASPIHRADIVRAVKDIRAAERLDAAVDLAIMLLVKRADQGVREAPAEPQACVELLSDLLAFTESTMVTFRNYYGHAVSRSAVEAKIEEWLALRSRIVNAPPVALAPADTEQE